MIRYIIQRKREYGITDYYTGKLNQITDSWSSYMDDATPCTTEDQAVQLALLMDTFYSYAIKKVQVMDE